MSYCWDNVRASCRNCMVSPITKQKALILLGILAFVMLFIIVLVVALPSTEATQESGSSVLTDYPVALGRSNLSYILKTTYKNQVFANNATILETYLSTNTTEYTGTQTWTVGSSDCSTAEFKDAMPQIMDQIDAIQSLTTLSDDFVIATSVVEITQALTNLKKAGVLSLDGGYAIGTRVSALRTYYNLGVRIMAIGGPTAVDSTSPCNTKWSEAADGNATVGLTDFGKEVVAEMNRLGMAIDLSGSSNQTIADALGNSTAPVLFSCAGAINITTNDNNLSDEQLYAAKTNGALVMVSFDSNQLCSNQSNCTLFDLKDTINYIADIVGRDNVGLGGGSLAYTYQTPDDVNMADGLTTLFDELNNQTSDPWSIDELKKLARENFVAFMTEIEASSKELASVVPSELFEPVADLGSNSTLYPCVTDWDIFYSDSETTEASVTEATTNGTSSTEATTKVTTATEATTNATTT